MESNFKWHDGPCRIITAGKRFRLNPVGDDAMKLAVRVTHDTFEAAV